MPPLRLRKTGDTTSVVQGARLVAVRGITLCVTRGELAQGLVWVGMWALGVCVCVCVALGSAWVTYDLHMEKMRCCYL